VRVARSVGEPAHREFLGRFKTECTNAIEIEQAEHHGHIGRVEPHLVALRRSDQPKFVFARPEYPALGWSRRSRPRRSGGPSESRRRRKGKSVSPFRLFVVHGLATRIEAGALTFPFGAVMVRAEPGCRQIPQRYRRNILAGACLARVRGGDFCQPSCCRQPRNIGLDYQVSHRSRLISGTYSNCRQTDGRHDDSYTTLDIKVSILGIVA